MPASNTLFLPPSARLTRRLRINLRPVMPISCHRHRKLAECTRNTTALARTGFGCMAYWNPPMVRIDHEWSAETVSWTSWIDLLVDLVRPARANLDALFWGRLLSTP